MDKIRNFCIIAHIDHGKSTLADRMMELTGTVEKRGMKAQLLDSMTLERERGITIKLAPVTMNWRPQASDVINDEARFDEEKFLMAASRNFAITHAPTFTTEHSGFYELNLIDTPGHVDFSYEVSRSLAAVEGAILVVDATQGIQAQTLQNLHLALEQKLTIIPVLNKIDLPAADVDKVSQEIIDLLNCSGADILHVSAKTGQGVAAVLNAIVAKIPAPISPLAEDEALERLAKKPDMTSLVLRAETEKLAMNEPLRALIFDSYYDDYRGVILYVRIVDGAIERDDDIFMMNTKKSGLALEIGKLTPKTTATSRLNAGEIGYVVTNLKTTRDAKVGDTISLTKYFKE